MFVRGYKVFNSDWTCRDKQYACPGRFEEEGELSICRHGMHFCKRAVDCFDYYIFNPNNKIAEVIAYGDVEENGDKCCTNKIEIVREIPWSELLKIVNMGKDCTGCGNSGNYNSGNCNTGNWNSGNYNSGNRNSGNWNTGSYNSGNCNTGSYNSGVRNSGSWNAGSWNTGDWNKTNYSNGCFNTEEPKIYMFNKPSNWTLQDWLNSEARYILKQISFATDANVRFSDSAKEIIKSIPNFNKEIFKEITGIDIDL